MNAITPSASPTNAIVGGATYTPSATALGGTVAISVDSTTSANCAINAEIRRPLRPLVIAHSTSTHLATRTMVRPRRHGRSVLAKV